MGICCTQISQYIREATYVIKFRLLAAQKLQLSTGDRERRYEMCEWLVNLSDEELVNIAFTDEANFCLGKVFFIFQ